jgi:YbbR domain-containing protein
LNKKILIAIIVIAAISIAGTVALNALLANNSTSQFRGTMVFQSDVTGVNVAILGPEETLKTGVIGDNGELTFTGLPDGNYQAIANKEGYSNHYVLSTSINHGGRTTVPIYMTTVPEQDPLHLSTNPNAVIIKQGSSGTVTATATSLNEYVGEVSMSCNVLPSGVTAAFNPESGSVTAGGKVSLILTLTVSSTATKGIYQVYIDLDYGGGGIGGYGLLLQVS